MSALDDAGFDIVHELDLERLALPWLGDRRRGLLIGNTRALWPRFLAAVRADRELAAAAHPLDRYCERALAIAFPDDKIWFGHRRYAEAGGFVPLVKIAVASGLATLAPSQLAIHPVYGPWFALRAVVACDAGHVAAVAPAAPAPCACSRDCTDALVRAMSAHGPDAWRAWLAVRDACAIGRQFRYSEDQLRYHYTKDRALLG